nr:MipA/OmpV family protein [Endozoicomonas sp.]
GNTIPSIYYEDDNLFFRGDEWGIKAWANDRWAINPVARRRWVHLPKAVQNKYQEDAIDVGVQALWQRAENQQWRFELLTESDWKYQLYAGHDWQLRYDRLQLNAKAGLRLKSGKYNSYYYGLNYLGGEDINGGVDGVLSMDFRYPWIGNFYLTGGLEWTQMDANARHSPAIDRNGYGTVKLGVAFFEQGNDMDASIPDDAYLRVAHGWATPSNMGEIFRGNGVKDSHNNQMTSVFYGHPLQKGWLLEAMDVYLVGGLVYHAKSSVQSVGWESVLAIKAYYNFAWPVRWRLGVAEGMSYISNLTYIEKNEMDEKAYNPSKLMNALDLSLDANLGDLTTIKELDTAWFGYSLHHRSSIFERASHFGRIKGGSNYNTIYLQWHF